MEENPYKATVNITHYETKAIRRPPRQISYLRGFVLFVALIFGQAAVITLSLSVQEFFHPRLGGPSDVWTYACFFLIAAIICVSLFWLSQKIEAPNQGNSNAPTGEIGDSE